MRSQTWPREGQASGHQTTTFSATIEHPDQASEQQMKNATNGTEGYSENAQTLARQYESVTFADVHRDVLHLFPAPPARVVDIGAGSGRDAAALAARGYSVLAIEPTDALRQEGTRLHAGKTIDVARRSTSRSHSAPNARSVFRPDPPHCGMDAS
jgi:2-polyprenyl-3-methyl-5-hydroxy-6-metoxy-1,4-benzoquinol methylase